MTLRPYRTIILLFFLPRAACTGFHADDQGGQCKTGLSLFCDEEGDKEPDEAAAGYTEEHADRK